MASGDARFSKHATGSPAELLGRTALLHSRQLGCVLDTDPRAVRGAAAPPKCDLRRQASNGLRQAVLGAAERLDALSDALHVQATQLWSAAAQRRRGGGGGGGSTGGASQ